MLRKEKEEVNSRKNQYVNTETAFNLVNFVNLKDGKMRKFCVKMCFGVKVKDVDYQFLKNCKH